MEGDRKSRRIEARRRHTRKAALKIMAGSLAGAVLLPALGATEAEAGRIGNRIVREGRRHLGIPYVPDGTSLKTGLDCDALVRRVLGRLNIWCPWGPGRQAVYGRGRRGGPHPGDVVYFYRGGRVWHVGLYSGGGYCIHASDYFNKVVESWMDDIGGYGGARAYR